MHPVKIANMVITAEDFKKFLGGISVIQSRADKGCVRYPDPFFVTEQGVPFPRQAMAWIAGTGGMSPNDTARSTCGCNECCTPSHLTVAPVSEDNPTRAYRDSDMKRSTHGGRFYHSPVDEGNWLQYNLRKSSAFVSIRYCSCCGHGADEIYRNSRGDTIGLCCECHRAEQKSAGARIERNRRSKRPASTGGYRPRGEEGYIHAEEA